MKTHEDKLRHATVDVVDAVAKDAIRHGCSPLKLWIQMSTRIIAASRTSTGPQEWSSKLMRAMRIVSPSMLCSQAVDHLAVIVGSKNRDIDAWLTMVEREAGFIIASVRVRREERKKEIFKNDDKQERLWKDAERNQ